LVTFIEFSWFLFNLFNNLLCILSSHLPQIVIGNRFTGYTPGTRLNVLNRDSGDRPLAFTFYRHRYRYAFRSGAAPTNTNPAPAPAILVGDAG
jgi:hypothetical protein